MIPVHPISDGNCDCDCDDDNDPPDTVHAGAILNGLGGLGRPLLDPVVCEDVHKREEVDLVMVGLSQALAM